MKTLFLAFFIAASAFASLSARESPLERFKMAGDTYAKNDFEAAKTLYESLLAENRVNAELLYNLGNTYFRLGRPGKALVYFERASRLAPNDSDIRQNISFLRQTIREPEEPFGSVVINLLSGVMPLNTLLLITSVLFFITSLTFALFMLKKKRAALYGAIGATSLLILSGGLLAVKIEHEILSRWAIVISGPAEVRNGPGALNSVGFSLSEGRKVQILSKNNEWFALSLNTEGFKGWLEKKYLEEI